MSRTYDIDGKKYYSVTTILGILDKPALIPWAVKSTAAAFYNLLIENGKLQVHDENSGTFSCDANMLAEWEQQAKKNYRKVSEVAMSYGTTVHELIESYCHTGIAPDLKDDVGEVQTAWAAWMAWVEEHDYEPLLQEVEVFNHDYKYAGRFDAIAKVNGVVTLLDFKTSTGIYDEMLFQLAAYWKGDTAAITQLPKIEQAGILRLDKVTGLPEWKVFTLADLAHGWEVFSHLAKVYYLIKGEPKERKTK